MKLSYLLYILRFRFPTLLVIVCCLDGVVSLYHFALLRCCSQARELPARSLTLWVDEFFRLATSDSLHCLAAVVRTGSPFTIPECLLCLTWVAACSHDSSGVLSWCLRCTGGLCCRLPIARQPSRVTLSSAQRCQEMTTIVSMPSARCSRVR